MKDIKYHIINIKWELWHGHARDGQMHVMDARTDSLMHNLKVNVMGIYVRLKF